LSSTKQKTYFFIARYSTPVFIDDMPNKRAPGQRSQSFSLSQEELDKLRAVSDQLQVPMSGLIRDYIATLQHPNPDAIITSEADRRRNPKTKSRRKGPVQD
jgi:hypothetical protein